MKTEIARRATLTDSVAGYFKAHPNLWIDMAYLEKVGGRGGWRTRVSDCRLVFKMEIQNRQQRSVLENGSILVRSFYRYVPAVEVDVKPAQQGLFT